MNSARRRELALNLGLAVGIFVALCGAAELGLRYFLLHKYNPFEPDAAAGVRLKRSYDGAYPRVRVRTDSHGHRVPLDQRVDATGRFLFIGDSVTFGFSMPAEESFPLLIAGRLGDRADATLAAVPGYNLHQALLAGRESVRWAKPEFIVYTLVVNDVSSALSPATYDGLDPAAARAHRGGFLARSAFAAFVERRFRRLTARFNEPETEQRSSNVIRDYVAELAPEVDGAFRDQWKDLERFQEEVGVSLYVVVAPFAFQVYEEPGARGLQDYVAGLCAGSALVCLDPLPAFLARSDEPLFTGGSSYHFNRAGHALLADWLTPRLAASPHAEPPR